MQQAGVGLRFSSNFKTLQLPLKEKCLKHSVIIIKTGAENFVYMFENLSLLLPGDFDTGKFISKAKNSNKFGKNWNGP